MNDLYFLFFEGFWKRLLLAAILALAVYGYFFSGLEVGSDCHRPYAFFSKRTYWSRTACDTWTTYRYGEGPVTTTKTLPRIIRH